MKIRRITSGAMIAATLLLGAAAQAATTIVDFTHTIGTANARTVDSVSPDGYIWNFSDSGEPLLAGSTNPANKNNTIYGGLNVTWDDPTNYTPIVQLNPASTSLYVQNNAGTSKQRVRGLLVWNRADFLNHSTNDYVVFDAESSMATTISLENGTTRARFLVNDGGDYYVSSNYLSNAETMILNDPGAITWAPVSTTTYAIGAYTNQTFSDIQGVGLYVDQSANNQTQIRITDFQVSATTTTNPPPEKPVDATIIDFTQGSGTANLTNVVDYSSATGKEWNFSDTKTLFSGTDNPANSNNKVYGGLQAFWPESQADDGIYQLNTVNGFKIQVKVTDAVAGTRSIKGMMVWNKADFLDFSSTTVVFNANSSMNIARSGGTTRFVVNDGGTYYVANTTDTTLDNPGTALWAPISTDDYSIGTYTNQTFTDIQGVGFYVTKTATGTQQVIFKVADFTVVAARAIPPSDDPYENWINKYYLAGDDAALDADIENGGLGDGMDNLLEYAIGGNPNVDDAASVQPAGFASDTGTWFYYVYGAREDDQTLSYTVYVDNDLVADPSWSTNGISFVGESGLDSDGYKTVTNSTDMGNAEFIKLQVERTK